ncbi:Ribosomal protein [Trema orientale]|uniref:Ribosomal protein n=1 Tax=Trema orientale TaxID=63057 RepID=A0A2P5FK95_TREOI|nr:Ribosomal protein [Trema orientale]
MASSQLVFAKRGSDVARVHNELGTTTRKSIFADGLIIARRNPSEKGIFADVSGCPSVKVVQKIQLRTVYADGPTSVSDEGDVLYVFPKDYRAKLATKSVRIKLEPLFEKAKAATEYLVRVSFGTALIASIVIVYTTIIAILSSRSEEDNRGRRGRSYDTGFTFYLSPTDLFWFTETARARIEKAGGECLTFDQLALRAPLGQNTFPPPPPPPLQLRFLPP